MPCTNCNRIWQHCLLIVCCFTHICQFNLKIRKTNIYCYYYTLFFLCSSLFSKLVGVSLTKHFLFTHLRKFSNDMVYYTLSITAFCILIHRTGRKLSCSKLYCDLFAIVPVVESINSIIQGRFLLPYFLVAYPSSLCIGRASQRWWCEGCDCWKLLRILSMLLLWFC